MVVDSALSAALALTWVVISALSIFIIILHSTKMRELKNISAQNDSLRKKVAANSISLYVLKHILKYDIKDEIEMLKCASRPPKLKIARVEQNTDRFEPIAILPEFATDGSSGMDLCVCGKGITVMPNEVLCIGTGLRFEIERGYEIQVRPRSGLSLKTKLRLPNSPGTIDSDYRGEAKIIVENTGNEPISFEHGDRIAQAIVCRCYRPETIIVQEEELSQTIRGEGGMGSTGVKMGEFHPF